MNKMKYSKHIFLIIIFFLFPKDSFAFTCTAVAGGGNWNSASTWSGCNSTIPQTGDDVVLDATSGNVAVNANTNNLKSFDMTGYTNTLSGASTINIIGSAGVTNNIIFAGTITWTGLLQTNPGSATSNLNITTNGKVFRNWAISGSNATVQLQDNFTFDAVKTSVLTIGTSGATLDMNGFTISGDSTVNRLLVSSNVVGTQSRPINRNGGAFANADFMDIDLTASYDCSAITGLCGDAGGNSADFTFTTAATQTYSGSASFDWDVVGNWTSRIPLPQDDVVINGTFTSGRTIVADMPRLGKNVDISGATWSGTALTFSNSAQNSVYGSFLLPNGIVWSANNGLSFRGRDSYSFMSGGTTIITGIIVNAPDGTVTLLDALNQATNSNITIINGTFDANDYNVTAIGLVITNFSTLILGNGTITLTGTGNVFSTNSGNVVTPENSTIVVSNTTATAKTFVGATKIYNNLTITGNNVTISGSNTFNGLALNTAGLGISTKFTAGTTQRIASFEANGSAGNLASASSTSASLAYIHKYTPGRICEDYVNFQSLSLSFNNTWYVGANSTDSGGNEQAYFTACPTDPTYNTESRNLTPANENIRGGFKVRGGVKMR